ncbi:MAG: phosphopantothenoylcysteine decarboxylase [Planctomycetota bacterium]|nr:phosphopantothenoylcysteine decarboxylase [Planctomycetota bacterium]
MSRILITSGPTRQYLDPVRYLTNASSGRMGSALAQAALEDGHDVVIVSGPVDIEYPRGAKVVSVVSTEEMLSACQDAFFDCDGVIGAAAPCDYRPVRVSEHKIAKTGHPLELNLIETEDVIATLSRHKEHRWMVGFALETEDPRLRALAKLEKKSCDLMILNSTDAMNALDNSVEILDPSGQLAAAFSGHKEDVARSILGLIRQRLIQPPE